MALADLGDLSIVPTWWLSPRDPSTITKDGSDRVSAIADKGSGAGGGAAQSTDANKPVYVASSNINSQPALRTDGVDDFLTFTQPWSDVSTVRLTNSTTSITATVLGTSYNTDAGAHALTAPTLIMLRWSGTSLTFWDGGVLKRSQGVGATSAPGALFFVVGLNSAGESATGRFLESGYLYNRAANDRTADGDHGDFAYYDSAIDDTLRQEVEGVLCWAYGIALPSGHPYESTAPTTGGGGASHAGSGATAGAGFTAAAALADRPLAGAAGGVGSATGDMGHSGAPGSLAGVAIGFAAVTASVTRRTPLMAAAAGGGLAQASFTGGAFWLRPLPAAAAWSSMSLTSEAWVVAPPSGQTWSVSPSSP